MKSTGLLVVFLTNLAFAEGPAPGSRIPDFRLPDQNGRTQSFDTIRGPKGAMIVFYRSADW